MAREGKPAATGATDPSAATENAAPAVGHGHALNGRLAILLAVVIAAAAGFVLCGYELLRTTANTLYAEAYGKKGFSFILALVPIGVTIVVFVYSRLLSRLGPRLTLYASTLLAVMTMLACYFGIKLGIKPMRGVLFVFKESYVVLLVEQLWSYINSMLSRESGKKLNGLICAIASIGAIAGAEMLHQLSARFGTVNMIVLAALTTLPAIVMAELVFRRHGEPQRPPVATGAKVDHLGLSLFRKERMLLLLICLIGAGQLLATVTDFAFRGQLNDQFPSADAQNAFSGRYYAWLNGLAMIAQLFAVPVIIGLVPLRYIHIAIPLVHIGSCAYLFLYPSLFSAGFAYMVFKVVDYSIFRASKELLYVPLSFDVRYRAKEIIDVFGYRVSKGVTSIAITLLQSVHIILSTGMLALLGMAGAGAWLLLVLPIARHDAARRAAAPTLAT